LFIALPLVELALLFWIARHTGGMVAFGLVIVTGLAGATLARHQGLRCWREVQTRLERGEVPADDLLEGLMILLAAAVLVTPGVITDAVGFALLVPPLRRKIRAYLARRIQARIVAASGRPEAGFPPDQDDVIDVEHRSPDEGSR
jgi:UPF0716 protein FxsA